MVAARSCHLNRGVACIDWRLGPRVIALRQAGDRQRRAVVSETGVENLYRVDVSISFPGADPIMRPVTGFIGEPVPPGQSNRSWSRGPESPGVRE